MQPSTRRDASMFDQPVPEMSRGPAHVMRLPNLSSGNDASHGTASSLRGEAWPAPVDPTIAPDHDVNSPWPTYQLYHEARSRRAALLGAGLAAATHAAGTAVRKLYQRYAQFRRAQETYTSLRELDDRTLRDLGFTRDEIRSVAAEMASDAEPARRLARATFPACPSLFQLLFGE